MAYPIDTPAELIGQLYVGYFGRAADPDGLNYWIGRYNSGMSLAAIANSFAVQPEATAMYSYLAAPLVGDPVAFITAIYQDLFNRDPDAQGLAYWVNQLTVQGMQPGQMVLNIISGAQGSDKTTIENKTYIAVTYAEQFVDGNVPWKQIDNTAGAREVVDGVTFDPATVTAAEAQIQAIVVQEQTNPAGIALSINANSILAGSGFDVVIQADPSQAGKTVQYTINGVPADQIAGGNLTGTVVLGSDSKAVVHIDTLVADLNGAPDTATVTVGPITSSGVTINQGTQSVSPSPAVLAEGAAFTFTVTTSGVAPGSVEGRTETYTISGPGLAHIPVAERSGTVTLDANGNAVVTVHTLADLINSGVTSVTITVAQNPPVNVTIQETAFQVVTPSTSDVLPGQGLTFTVDTFGVAGSAVAGQVETWTLSGAGIDQVAGSLSGTLTLDSNGSATVSVGTMFGLINGPQSEYNLVFTVTSGSTITAQSEVVIEGATLTVTPPALPVEGGQQVTYTLTGVNIPNGTTFTYTLSGDAAEDVVGSLQGTVTVNNGTATIVVQTKSDGSGATEGLTLTIDDVANAAATAAVAMTAPETFILTTGTDNFTGNPAGDNTFIAVANSNPLTASSTLGQNDNLNGGGGEGNTLFLSTTGLLGQTINAFTTNGIQTFVVNAGQGFTGTTIDMSSAFGVTKLVNSNSSGDLTLLNVVAPIEDLQLVNPSDILGGSVDMVLQYQAAGKPASQTLTLDPTVSPITGLPNSKFWVNVPVVTINSIGPGTNGLVSINGATGPFAATALTRVNLTGGTDFVAGVNGAGLAALAFTGGSFSASANMLDLSAFTGTFHNVGDPGDFASITSVGGLTIYAGAGGIDGNYFPAPGFTGASQFGGDIVVGGNFSLAIGNGNVSNQHIEAVGAVSVYGSPLGAAAGGLLNAEVITFGANQSYQGFNGGLTGSLTTAGGNLNIGFENFNYPVNGVIDVAISTGTGWALVRGGNGNVTLDFSGAGTTGFHGGFFGPDTDDRFLGGSAMNTLIFDPMINNTNSTTTGYGIGRANMVQTIVLDSQAGTPWNGTAGGAPGLLPTNTVDLGLLNRNDTWLGIRTDFAQTIHLDGPLGSTGQSFRDAVSGDHFIIDSSQTGGPGGSLKGQVMAFDFALPTASNTLSLTVNNINWHGGAPALTIRDFEVNTVSAGSQNPVTTLNLTANRYQFSGQTNNTFTLDTLNRLQTLSLQGTANHFNDLTATVLTILAAGGAGTLSKITGGDANIDISALAGGYLSTADLFVDGKQANQILLGNGMNTIVVGDGSWYIQTGLVPGGGTAGDSGDTSISMNPGLGSLTTAKSGGGDDVFNVGNQGGIVQLYAGAGNDTFNFDMSGIFPGLNSAQTVNGGDGWDGIVLKDGALNQNDSLFGQVTSVESLTMATGMWNNSLLLNYFANGSGLKEINTTGGGSSNVFFMGTGFTNPLTFNIAEGDTGYDAIIAAALPSGTNAITVNTTTAGFNTAFTSGLDTAAINPGTGLPTKSGIFGNPFADNVLNLQADGGTANLFGNGVVGINNVETVNGKFGGFGVGMTVNLATPPSAGSHIATIDLEEVAGATTVFGNVSTTSLDITGSGGAWSSNTLFGGLAADTIVAKGTAVGLGTNFLWGGGGGGDTLTGVAGGPGDNVGTTFLINSKAESPGGAQQTAAGIDVTITNFHSNTDTLLINPAALSHGGIPVFIGVVADYSQALAALGGSTGIINQAVYQDDINALWIDANDDGLLNTQDIKVFVDFASPAFNLGTYNFGDLLGLFNGPAVEQYIFDKLNPPSFTTVDHDLAWGELVIGTPSLNDTLILNEGVDIENGNVGVNQAWGFEFLDVQSTFHVSVAQWNWFTSPDHAINPAAGVNTVIFSDGFDPQETAFTTQNNIENYDLSLLTMASTVTIRDGASDGTITGSNQGDTYIARPVDLWPNWVNIDAGSGNDTLILSQSTATVPGGILKIDPTGGGNVDVSGIENLVLSSFNGAANDVRFQGGGSFKNVTGTEADSDFITTGTMVGGGLIQTLGDDDKVTLSSNLVGTTVDLGGDDDVLQSAVGGVITTTLNGGAGFDTLALINGDDISGASVSNFEALDLANNATVTMTVQQWNDIPPPVFGAFGLETIVYKGAGGVFTTDDDVESYNLSALTSGSTVSIDDFQNGGGAITGSGKGDKFITDIDEIDGTGSIKILGGAGADTLQLTTSGFIILDADSNGPGRAFVNGVESLLLANGNNDVDFQDGGVFKNVTGGTGEDEIDTGTMVGGGLISLDGDNDFVLLASNLAGTTIDLGDSADELEIDFNGSVTTALLDGGLGTDTLRFDNQTSNISTTQVVNFETLSMESSNVTMSFLQYSQFTSAVDGDGTNTITLTTAGALGTAFQIIDTYNLVGGSSMTLNNSNEDVNVNSTSAGNTTLTISNDVWNGTWVLNGTGDTLVANGTNTISGVNGGAATTAENLTLASVITMTNAQHNGFTSIAAAGGSDQITITNDFTGVTRAGVETYVLNDADGGGNYDIGASDQTVNDLNNPGTQTVDILGGLSNVTLNGTAGATFIVNATNGGTDIDVNLGGANDTVSYAGGHTGADISLGAGNDTLAVSGIVSGTADGGAHTTGDTLALVTGADISGLAVSKFETLSWVSATKATLNAATWDQFVATDGKHQVGHDVSGELGFEVLTLSNTTASTTALSEGNGIDNYVLANTGDDAFRVNVSTTYSDYTVDVAAGGSDAVTIVKSAIVGNQNVAVELTGFQAGPTAGGGDVMKIFEGSDSISDVGFQVITSAGQDVVIADDSVVVIGSSVGELGPAWSEGDALTLLSNAIDDIAGGEWTFVAYNGADAYVMIANLPFNNTFLGADVDLVGIVRNVGQDALTADNFA